MRASPRTTLAGRAVPAIAMIGVVLAGAGCSADEPGTPDPTADPASASPTPLASYATDGLAVARRDPCAAVDPERLADVLGGEPTEERAWAPGQRVPGTPEIGDEWGCSRAAGGVTARAWVFGPAVGRSEAARLTGEAAGEGCDALEGEGFGRPGASYGCDLDAGRLTGHAGLVGDAWVVCEVVGGEPAAADRWCVAVLDSLTQD